VYLQGVGDLKLKWHRPLPADAQIKTVTAKREAGHGYVCFSVEVPEPEPLPASDVAVGIDVGLTTFAVCSDGAEIANPRHFRAAERRLRNAQRKLARRKKRSRRRLKARQELARVHVHVANQRRNFHHEQARLLVQEHGLIAVEDLNFKGLAGSMLAKDCSACGTYVPKTLSERWHRCACGLSISRGFNAARKVLLRAVQGLGWSLQAPTVDRYSFGASHAVA